MKKLAVIAALVIAFTSMTYAQKQGTSTVTANAKIIQGLVLGTISGPLNFGDAQNIIVKGAEVGTDTVVAVMTSDSRAVNFSATGDGGASIAVSYPATGTLTGSVSGTLTFTPSTAWTATSTWGSPTSFVSGAVITLGGTAYTVPGTRYIWLGGTLGTAAANVSNAAPGLYSGTFVITVAYSGE